MWFAIDSKCAQSFMVDHFEWNCGLSMKEAPNSVTLYPKLRPIVVQNSQFHLVKKKMIRILQKKKRCKRRIKVVHAKLLIMMVLGTFNLTPPE
jgi:hypothetical protein